MKTKFKFYSLLTCLFMATFFTFTSCDSDESTKEITDGSVVKKDAKDILNGDIVLSTKATINGVDKTLVKTGCPTKYNFSWKEDGVMVLAMKNFKVGNMPFKISFACQTKFKELNSWEKDEYKGGDWVKFEGTDGKITLGEESSGDYKKGSGAHVDGYLNLKTQEIEFVINFNMFTVKAEALRQKIDKTRIDRFDEEVKQYLIDLEKAKKGGDKP